MHRLGDILDLASDTLLQMIGLAFTASPDQIIGAPKWAKTVRYKLAFKLPSGQVDSGFAGLRQEQRMLRDVLANRFHLKVHGEIGQEQARVLTIGARGAKLQVSQPHEGQSHW
jgi:uncharacterized protein (TIGR03435 family)